MMTHIGGDSASDSIPSTRTASDTSDDSEDFAKRMRRPQGLKARGPKTASYQVSQLTPLSTSPAWDEINAQLDIRLTGPESLRGLCHEAHFVRSRLMKTSSALLTDFTQAEAAFFCLEQITDENTTEDLRVAFAKLLPHSLSHASQWPELTINILNLVTNLPTLCQRLPLVTMNAIEDYFGRLPPPSGSEEPRIAAEVVPKPVPKSSTKATTGQKASTTPTSSTASQKSSPSLQSYSTNATYGAGRLLPQSVPRLFLVPSHSTPIHPPPLKPARSKKPRRSKEPAPSDGQQVDFSPNIPGNVIPEPPTSPPVVPNSKLLI